MLAQKSIGLIRPCSNHFVVVYDFKTGLGGSPNRIPDLPKVADGAGTGNGYVYNL
jgi:hypothetical protein